MSCQDFKAQRYRDTDTGRYRWAVLHLKTRVFYFQHGRGRKAASAYARRLNKGGSTR